MYSVTWIDYNKKGHPYMKYTLGKASYPGMKIAT